MTGFIVWCLAVSLTSNHYRSGTHPICCPSFLSSQSHEVMIIKNILRYWQIFPREQNYPSWESLLDIAQIISAWLVNGLYWTTVLLTFAPELNYNILSMREMVCIAVWIGFSCFLQLLSLREIHLILSNLMLFPHHFPFSLLFPSYFNKSRFISPCLFLFLLPLHFYLN